MSEKEYIVTLNKNVDYAVFDAEMIATTGSGAIPQRSAPISNPRPGSKRNTHYLLTDDEANTLRLDPRVLSVEIPPEQRDDIKIGIRATQPGNFNKSTSDSGDLVNWGLIRCNESTNVYGTGTNTSQDYNYTLDGTGVDIVIQDSGIQADHPDFNDANGVSRVQQIDWYQESGISGTQSANHYRDYDGHGTHCAGIAAGKTYGWGKNARIYAVKVAGLEGQDDSGTGISVSDCFDVIKLWHRNKPVDPATGVKRPTIVNMSWGYGGYYQFDQSQGHSINYRGDTYSGLQVDTANDRLNYGLPIRVRGTIGGEPYYDYNSRIASVDADIEELLEEGVHVCIAAGNNSYKIEVENGTDWNNTASCSTYNFGLQTFTPGSFNVHKGSSPQALGAHIVGNVDSSVTVEGLDRKAQSSECGPAVTVYAPGTNIMSTTSTTNKFTDGEYPADTNFRICNISGTSMASPQIAGILSLYCQLNPDATPDDALQFIIDNSTDQLYNTSNDDDFNDIRSLLSTHTRLAFNKFNSAIQLTIGSS